jgi:hypothetical protein
MALISSARPFHQCISRIGGGEGERGKRASKQAGWEDLPFFLALLLVPDFFF